MCLGVPGVCWDRTSAASVYKTNPFGLKYTAGMPAEVATCLQQVAWEPAQNFHAPRPTRAKAAVCVKEQGRR